MKWLRKQRRATLSTDMSNTHLILHVKGTEQETTTLPKQVVRAAISQGTDHPLAIDLEPRGQCLEAGEGIAASPAEPETCARAAASFGDGRAAEGRGRSAASHRDGRAAEGQGGSASRRHTAGGGEGICANTQDDGCRGQTGSGDGIFGRWGASRVQSVQVDLHCPEHRDSGGGGIQFCHGRPASDGEAGQNVLPQRHGLCASGRLHAAERAAHSCSAFLPGDRCEPSRFRARAVR
jgi:hypothetical protein